MIIWKENLAVGDPQIDREHQAIFQRVDKLLLACQQGAGIQEVSVLLRFLDVYVLEHFNREISLMRSTRYPAVESHLAFHQSFVEKMNAFKLQVAIGSFNNIDVANINQWMVDWLVNHVSREDKKFAQFLRARGAA